MNLGKYGPYCKEDNCFTSLAVKEQLDLELGSDDVPSKRILSN